MSISDFKLLYAASIIFIGLVISSPTLAMVTSFPSGERFSEFWVLGEGHMAEGYPGNVMADETYKVYLGVRNHMRGLEHYRVYVKFRNKTEPLPDSKNGTPSSLPSLFEYRFFLSEGQCWEREVVFSFSGIFFEGNISRIEYLEVNDYSFLVNKTVEWNREDSGFYYQLFFELWRCDSTLGDFQYHNSFVGFWVNATG